MGGPPVDTSDLIQIAVSSVEADDLYRGLCELVKRTAECDWVRICVRPHNEDKVHVRFVVSGGLEETAPSRTLPLQGSLPGRAIITGAPIVRGDITTEGVYPDERALASEAGLRSLLVVPLLSSGRIVGTLDLGSAVPGHFAGAAGLAQTFGRGAGAVVEHAWLMDECKEVTRLNERRRLAWEIHDTVIQSLISIVLQIELAERYLRSDVPRGCTEIAQVRELARGCLEDARRLVLNLRPPLLERSSLSEAIAREVRALEEGSDKIKAQFSVEGAPLPLPGEAEMTVYRIAQEGIANIRKHSRATQVTVALRYGPDVVELTITDNGVGFHPASVLGDSPDNGHMGLTGARQRAQVAGGTLRLEAAPGLGTKLMALIPITAAPSQPAALPPSSQPAPLPPPQSSNGELVIRVLLVDDHAVVREGLRRILEQAPDMEVVGEAGDYDEALEKARALRPDVTVVDVQLPGKSGIEFVSTAAGLGLGGRTLILSAHRGGDLILQAVKAGAHGYVLKDTAASALTEAIRSLQRGEMILHPAVSDDLAGTLGRVNENGVSQTLTARELEVLRLIALGMRNKEIARELCLTEATVKYHVAHLLDKLEADSRTEALIKAQKVGLLSQQFTAL